MTIIHPTDFSGASAVAFVHALKLAHLTGGELNVVHFAPSDDETSAHGAFPQVRATLERWQGLPPGSLRGADTDIGLRVSKVEVTGEDPTETILHYLDTRKVDMVVLGTHQRTGMSRWLYSSIAEPLAQNTHVPAMFFPPDVAGFVSAATGAVDLTRVVIPIDRTPDPKAAVVEAAGLVGHLGVSGVDVTLLHVGDETTRPPVDPPALPACRWETTLANGSVVDSIRRNAGGESEGTTARAGLLVMATEGRQGFVDALRGSTTERVLHAARCPLLTVPADLYD